MNETLPFSCLIRGETNEYLIYGFTFLGATLPLFIFAGVMYALFWRDKHTLYVSTTVLFISLWIYSVKELARIDRPRPWCAIVEFIGHGMPSLTATISVFLTLYYLYQFWVHARSVWSKWALFLRSLLLILYCGGVCFSRVFLMQCYPEDVLVGAVLGGVCMVLFVIGMRRHRDAQYKSTLKSD
jgi:membrane-associated phospholipid phosphatase